MKTIRDAISAGAKEVYCNSGLIIRMPDVHMNVNEMMSTVKIINGKRVIRWIYCTLGSMYTNRNVVDYLGVDDLIKANRQILYSHNDFIARERELNLLINLNNGIDEYETMYWVNGWMEML